jgi:hypothetical protein
MECGRSCRQVSFRVWDESITLADSAGSFPSRPMMPT